MTDADLVPLSQAAADALSRLVPEGVARSERALRSVELIARAIGAAIDVYARDPRSGALMQVDALDAPLQGELLVKRADVESVVDRLVSEYVGARSYAAVPDKPVRRARVAR